MTREKLARWVLLLKQLAMGLKNSAAGFLKCNKEGEQWEILFYIIFTTIRTLKSKGDLGVKLSIAYERSFENTFREAAIAKRLDKDRFMESLKNEMKKRFEEYKFASNYESIENIFCKHIKEAGNRLFKKTKIDHEVAKVVLENIERTVEETIQGIFKDSSNNES